MSDNNETPKQLAFREMLIAKAIAALTDMDTRSETKSKYECGNEISLIKNFVNAAVAMGYSDAEWREHYERYDDNPWGLDIGDTY